MKTELRADKSYKVTVALLFLLSMFSIIASSLVGEIFLSIATAFYAALLVFEKGNRPLSIILGVFGALITLIPLGVPSVWGIAPVVAGILIFLLYKSGSTKCDTAIVLTLFISAVIIISFFLFAFTVTGKYDFNNAISYYTELYETMKAGFINRLSDISLSMPEQVGEIKVSPDDVSMILDAVANMVISFIFIVAFFLSGVALKIFTALVRRYSEDKTEISAFRFAPPSVYAYFYLILFLAASFVGSSSVYEIALHNLYNIFLVIFVYLGIKAAYQMLTKNGRKFLAVILIGFALIFLGSLAMDLISVFGAFATIRANKNEKNNSGGSFDNTRI